MSEWVIKEHPEFFKDLDKIGKKELEIFYKKKQKIKENPIRMKHLSGGDNCYAEEITNNIRLVYYVQGNVVWLLTIHRHDPAYKRFRSRLYTLKSKYMEHGIE